MISDRRALLEALHARLGDVLCGAADYDYAKRPFLPANVAAAVRRAPAAAAAVLSSGGTPTRVAACCARVMWCARSGTPVLPPPRRDFF